MSSPNRWAYVTVMQSMNAPTQPIYVNVFGFQTKSEAQAFQRKSRQDTSTQSAVKVIADRVRPIIDDEFLEDLGSQFDAAEERLDQG